MKTISAFIMTFLLAATLTVSSQTSQNTVIPQIDNSMKGHFFAYWGYNRSAYTTSDIHFKGSNYDFTLSDISASDYPTKDINLYINPGEMTHPQYNWRMGYYINDKYKIYMFKIM